MSRNHQGDSRLKNKPPRKTLKLAIALASLVATIVLIIMWRQSYSSSRHNERVEPSGQIEISTDWAVGFYVEGGLFALVSWTGDWHLAAHRSRFPEHWEDVGAFRLEVLAGNSLSMDWFDASQDNYDYSKDRHDDDLNSMHVVFPIYFLIALFAFYPYLVFLRRPHVRWKRQRKGQCHQCGYDLAGNVTGVCSECGAEILEFDVHPNNARSFLVSVMPGPIARHPKSRDRFRLGIFLLCVIVCATAIILIGVVFREDIM